MQKRTASIILASTLAVGGGAVAFTPANAADSDNPVKNRLAGIKSALSGLVTDGTLTQDQADKVATTLDEKLPEGRGGRGGMPGENLAAAAKALGLTETELRAELKDGKSLAAIAKAEGVSTDTLVKALVAAAEAKLDAAVKADKITQEQADKRKETLTERITESINNVRPERRAGDAGKPADRSAPADDSTSGSAS